MGEDLCRIVPTQAIFELRILWQMQNILTFFHYRSLSRESLWSMSGNKCMGLERERKEGREGGRREGSEDKRMQLEVYLCY